MAKFHQVTDEEGLVYPTMKGYRMGCCDCDLVHNIDFEIVRVKDKNQPKEQDEVITDPELFVRLNVTRNNRSTSALRRRSHKRVIHDTAEEVQSKDSPRLSARDVQSE